MVVHYDLLCFALYLLALMAVAMGEAQLRVNEEPASSFLPPRVATVQAPFTNTTVAGCAWAGLICVDIGHACDEPKANKIAYDMARAHCHKKDEDEQQQMQQQQPKSGYAAAVPARFTNTTVAGCAWAGLICVDIGHACDEPKANKIAHDMARAHCHKKDEDEQQQMQQQFILFPEIAVKQQREEAQQTQQLSPQSGVDTTAVAALVQAPFTNTTVAGCVWAGLICVEIGHACDEPKANKIAYDMARTHCHKNEDDPVFV